MAIIILKKLTALHLDPVIHDDVPDSADAVRIQGECVVYDAEHPLLVLDKDNHVRTMQSWK